MPESVSNEEGVVYRLLVEAMPLAVFACTDGRIQYANPAGDALLGSLVIEDVIEKDFLTFVHSHDSTRVAEMLKQPRTHGGPIVWKSVNMVHRDGGLVPVELAAADLGNGCVQVIARSIAVDNAGQRQTLRSHLADVVRTSLDAVRLARRHPSGNRPPEPNSDSGRTSAFHNILSQRRFEFTTMV